MLGLCAFPGLPHARADVFVWAGGAGPDGASWCNQDNWIVGEGYPGRHDRADVVLIWGVDTQDPVVDCAPPFAIADLLVAGGGLDVVDALSVTGEVSVTDGARLDVSGTLDSSDVSAGKDVTMTVSGQWTGHPQLNRSTSRSAVPTTPSPLTSAEQSPDGGQAPQAPSRMSRSAVPTSPSSSRSPSGGRGSP